MKKIVILGSTGSIGINALKVVERYSDKFKIVGLTAYNNYKLLEKQINKFKPKFVAVSCKGFDYLKQNVNARSTHVLSVEKELNDIVSLKDVDIVLIAVCGSAALFPFLEAIKNKKTIATANKEAIVVAGDIIFGEANKYKARVIPIDSEQSAIFQCLEDKNKKDVCKVHLTASGGALLDKPAASFDKLTVKQILAHPRWKMGKKITVDSATLMNKGFEIIEAKWLFDLNINKINVLIHPEAIIHSMVEFIDGSIIAQLAQTDMKIPIQYALTYPKRMDTGLNRLDFASLKKLTFRKPDFRKFPSLALCIHAGEKGATYPCVLNAANEECVDAFLSKKIKFTDIYKIVEKIVLRHKGCVGINLNKIVETDKWAREEARKYIYS